MIGSIRAAHSSHFACQGELYCGKDARLSCAVWPVQLTTGASRADGKVPLMLRNSVIQMLSMFGVIAAPRDLD